jgi:hypothetical protein
MRWSLSGRDGFGTLSPFCQACEAGFSEFLEVFFTVFSAVNTPCCNLTRIKHWMLRCCCTRRWSGTIHASDGYVTSVASSNPRVHWTQWHPLTHHRTRPVSENCLWLLTRVNRTLSAGRRTRPVLAKMTVELWTRETHGEIWCTGRYWVRPMPVCRSIWCPRFLPNGSIRRDISIYTFGRFWDFSLDSLNTWDILWARELPLHSSPYLVVYSSEIEWDSSALLSDLHLVALDLWVGCGFLVTLGCFLTS